MKKSREEILACRSADCVWDHDAIADALTLRFPGTGKIDVKKLCRSWLDDRKLSKQTLLQCAMLARQVSGIRAKSMAKSAYANPRGYLEFLHGEL